MGMGLTRDGACARDKAYALESAPQVERALHLCDNKQIDYGSFYINT